MCYNGSMEEITGHVKNQIFSNMDNGYAVIELLSEGEEGELTAVGTLITLTVGERVRLYGNWVSHYKYGKQFSVTKYQILPPSTIKAMEDYLASGLIRGVGRVVAKQIIDTFGINAFEVIDKTPNRLTEIPGIGRIKASIIAASFMQQQGIRDVMVALQEYDITANQAMNIYKLYGSECVDIIRKNPYKLIEDVENIGFKTADKIALSAGFEFDSEFRVCAGIKYMLEWASREGHTYLPQDVLVSATVKTIGVETERVEEALRQMLKEGRLSAGETDGVETVALNYLRYKEKNVAKLLLKLKNSPPRFDYVASEEIERVESIHGITLAPMQRTAIEKLLTNSVVVVTGGPGTGKTTILRLAIAIMESRGIEYKLAAPTGRAAKRMGEATGRKARTLHRLLEYSFMERAFMRDENCPLETDVVIVDEMSMVDVNLMEALLRALDRGSRLIMVGDADQLPSVGAGNILRDIIDSETIESVRLVEIFRQAEKSAIVVNAHRINNGMEPELDVPDSDFCFEPMENPNNILQRIVSMNRSGFETPLFTNDPLNDVQVLAPMKKGILGVKNLNICLQQALNPPADDKTEFTYGNTVFREGDRVMQMKNDYNIEWTKTTPEGGYEKGMGIFNGDIGTVMHIDKGAQNMEILFDDGCVTTYDFERLESLELAYCISIHKSQGSEFPITMIPLLGGPPSFMTRNLLYTAVTRAKNQVYIIGSRECINAMVKNNQVNRRYSALCGMLKEYAMFGV